MIKNVYQEAYLKLLMEEAEAAEKTKADAEASNAEANAKGSTDDEDDDDDDDEGEGEEEKSTESQNTDSKSEKKSEEKSNKEGDPNNQEISMSGGDEEFNQDEQIQLLKSWHVKLPEKIDQNTTDLEQLRINNINYNGIFDAILDYRSFKKLYPDVDKSTCRLYTFSHNSEKSSNALSKSLGNFSIFKKLLDTIKSIGQQDPNQTEVKSSFVSCYITSDGTILKPNNIDDKAYANACQLIAGILTLDEEGKSKGKVLKTVDGKNLTEILEKKFEKIADDDNAKAKYKQYIENNYSNWAISVESKAWGEEDLKNLIKKGNEEVAKLKPLEEFIYPDFKAMGIEVKSGGTSDSIEIG